MFFNFRLHFTPAKKYLQTQWQNSLAKSFDYALKQVAVPVIAVATRTELATRWHDLMDVNAGTIADGDTTIEEVGWVPFLVDAGGRERTHANLGRKMEIAH